MESATAEDVVAGQQLLEARLTELRALCDDAINAHEQLMQAIAAKQEAERQAELAALEQAKELARQASEDGASQRDRAHDLLKAGEEEAVDWPDSPVQEAFTALQAAVRDVEARCTEIEAFTASAEDADVREQAVEAAAKASEAAEATLASRGLCDEALAHLRDAIKAAQQAAKDRAKAIKSATSAATSRLTAAAALVAQVEKASESAKAELENTSSEGAKEAYQDASLQLEEARLALGDAEAAVSTCAEATEVEAAKAYVQTTEEAASRAEGCADLAQQGFAEALKRSRAEAAAAEALGHMVAESQQLLASIHEANQMAAGYFEALADLIESPVAAVLSAVDNTGQHVETAVALQRDAEAWTQSIGASTEPAAASDLLATLREAATQAQTASVQAEQSAAEARRLAQEAAAQVENERIAAALERAATATKDTIALLDTCKSERKPIAALAKGLEIDDAMGAVDASIQGLTNIVQDAKKAHKALKGVANSEEANAAAQGLEALLDAAKATQLDFVTACEAVQAASNEQSARNEALANIRDAIKQHAVAAKEVRKEADQQVKATEKAVAKLLADDDDPVALLATVHALAQELDAQVNQLKTLLTTLADTRDLAQAQRIQETADAVMEALQDGLTHLNDASETCLATASTNAQARADAAAKAREDALTTLATIHERLLASLSDAQTRVEGWWSDLGDVSAPEASKHRDAGLALATKLADVLERANTLHAAAEPESSIEQIQEVTEGVDALSHEIEPLTDQILIEIDAAKAAESAALAERAAIAKARESADALLDEATRLVEQAKAASSTALERSNQATGEASLAARATTETLAAQCAAELEALQSAVTALQDLTTADAAETAFASTQELVEALKASVKSTNEQARTTEDLADEELKANLQAESERLAAFSNQATADLEKLREAFQAMEETHSSAVATATDHQNPSVLEQLQTIADDFESATQQMERSQALAQQATTAQASDDAKVPMEALRAERDAMVEASATMRESLAALQQAVNAHLEQQEAMAKVSHEAHTLFAQAEEIASQIAQVADEASQALLAHEAVGEAATQAKLQADAQAENAKTLLNSLISEIEAVEQASEPDATAAPLSVLKSAIPSLHEALQSARQARNDATDAAKSEAKARSESLAARDQAVQSITTSTQHITNLRDQLVGVLDEATALRVHEETEEIAAIRQSQETIDHLVSEAQAASADIEEGSLDTLTEHAASLKLARDTAGDALKLAQDQYNALRSRLEQEALEEAAAAEELAAMQENIASLVAKSDAMTAPMLERATSAQTSVPDELQEAPLVQEALLALTGMLEQHTEATRQLAEANAQASATDDVETTQELMDEARLLSARIETNLVDLQDRIEAISEACDAEHAARQQAAEAEQQAAEEAKLQAQAAEQLATIRQEAAERVAHCDLLLTEANDLLKTGAKAAIGWTDDAIVVPFERAQGAHASLTVEVGEAKNAAGRTQRLDAIDAVNDAAAKAEQAYRRAETAFATVNAEVEKLLAAIESSKAAKAEAEAEAARLEAEAAAKAEEEARLEAEAAAKAEEEARLEAEAAAKAAEEAEARAAEEAARAAEQAAAEQAAAEQVVAEEATTVEASGAPEVPVAPRDRPRRRLSRDGEDDRPRRRVSRGEDGDRPRRRVRSEDGERPRRRLSREADGEERPRRRLSRSTDGEERPQRRIRRSDGDESPRRRLRRSTEDGGDAPRRLRRSGGDEPAPPKSRRRRRAPTTAKSRRRGSTETPSSQR